MVSTRRYIKEILMKTTRSLAAVAVLALALPLAACSSDSSKDSGSAETTTATTAETTTATTAEASTAAPSSGASMAATVTDGQEAKAPTAGITFLAPSDWTVISDPANLDEAALSAAAEAMGQDPTTFKNTMKQVDLIVSSKEAKSIGSLPYADNIVVARQAYPESQVPTDEASATTFAKATGANNMTKYEKIGTANGDATVIRYDMTIQDGTGYGAVIFAPASGGNYAGITVSATDPSTVDELVARVTGSVK